MLAGPARDPHKDDGKDSAVKQRSIPPTNTACSSDPNYLTFAANRPRAPLLVPAAVSESDRRTVQRAWIPDTSSRISSHSSEEKDLPFPTLALALTLARRGALLRRPRIPLHLTEAVARRTSIPLRDLHLIT
jgi:hypothetical protein